MANDAALGRAVLELSTDDTKLDTGLSDVPKKVKKAGDAAKEAAEGPFKQLNGALELFGVGLSAGAVIEFGKSLLELGDNVMKVHDRTGLATDDVQRLQYIAEQSGNSIDDLAGSMSKLQVRLADGKAKDGIEALGLNFTKIRNASPYEALSDVAEAIGKIENPTLRAQRAVQIFGKAGTEILPTLVANFKQLGDEAPVANEETIRALDQAGDAFNRFGGQLKVWAADSYLSVGKAFDKMIAGIYRGIAEVIDGLAKLVGLASKIPGADKIGITKGLADSLKGQSVWFTDAAKGLETFTAAAVKVKPPLAALPPLHDAASKAAKAHAEAIAKLVAQMSGADLIASVADLSTVLGILAAKGPLTSQQMTALGAAAARLRNEGAILTPRLAELARIQDLLAAATAHATAAAKDQDDQWQKSRAATGQFLANVPTAIFQTRSFAGAVAQVSAEAAKFQGNLAGPRKAVVDWAGELALVSRMLQQAFGGGVGGAIASAFGAIGNAMDAAAASTKKWGNSAGLAAPLFSKTATEAQKAAAGVESGAAVAAGAMEVWAATSEKTGKAVGALYGAVAGAKAGSVFGPWGAAVGAAAGALVGFIRNLNAGRDAVVKFADSFDTAAAGSGFDELHAKMTATLGAAVGEKFWVQLTQQVKKGDKAGAAAVIAAIQEAMANAPSTIAADAGYKTTAELQAIADKAKQVYDYMLASGQYSASELARAFQASADAQKAVIGDTAQAQTDAIDAIQAKYKESIDALDSEYKSLSDSVGQEQEEAVMGVVETQQRARMAEIEQQKAALEQKQADEIAAAKETADAGTQTQADAAAAAAQAWKENFGDVVGQGYQIPITFTYPNGMPGGFGSQPAVPMANGGSGRVTRPTLFFSRGDEDFAFSGEGKSFGLGALASRPIHIENVTNLDGRVVARNQIRHTPDALARAGVRSR